MVEVGEEMMIFVHYLVVQMICGMLKNAMSVPLHEFDIVEEDD
jgi:hypothetical protein